METHVALEILETHIGDNGDAQWRYWRYTSEILEIHIGNTENTQPRKAQICNQCETDTKSRVSMLKH